jgi:predicted outer membrane lipoprotein
MQTTQKYFYILGLLFALAFGIWSAKLWYAKNDSIRASESQVLLEHIKNVSKLVTVEGYFSEIYTETDTKDYYFFSSTKKALIKVKAKVSAGFDLSNMKIDADQTTKTLRLTNIPQPNIISVEPEISYYDIANGVFNQFTNEDYSRLNKKAVDTIRVQALKSDFMDNVKTQGVKNFDAIRALAESMGWKVVFDNNIGIKPNMFHPNTD